MYSLQALVTSDGCNRYILYRIWNRVEDDVRGLHQGRISVSMAEFGISDSGDTIRISCHGVSNRYGIPRIPYGFQLVSASCLSLESLAEFGNPRTQLACGVGGFFIRGSHGGCAIVACC